MPAILRIFSYQKVASLLVIGSFESCATVATAKDMNIWNNMPCPTVYFFRDRYLLRMY